MKIDPNRPLFPISTVADILGCPQKTLRLYDKNRLVSPARNDGKRRLYSQRDIEKLELVHHMVQVLGVNAAGVRIVLSLLEHVDPERLETIIGSAKLEAPEAAAAE
jgi:MerR family transcriptional regulator/heat shock protein HspR